MTVVMFAVSNLRQVSPRNSLHSLNVEAAADLIGSSDGEALAGGGEHAALLKCSFQRSNFGFDALEEGVGLADRVGEGFVAERLWNRC